MQIDSHAIRNTIETLEQELLKARNPAGYWEGFLSSSALSTATAVFALAVVDVQEHIRLIEKGLSWLSENQNRDGGWGDTTDSPSNLSTTLLCYCAFGIEKEDKQYSDTVKKIESWLVNEAGGLEPAVLAKALDGKYGNDKGFSAPILTMCAMAGRLGDGQDCWRYVKSLPFELALLPHQLFKWLRLPVVSYALTALIAIGRAEYYHYKPRNPFVRLIRHITQNKVLDILKCLQPDNGGFIESAPLTAFVVMNLAGRLRRARSSRDSRKHIVVEKGVDFLVKSVREDGSWPIDTNLASWVTTMSLNALATGDGIEKSLSMNERGKILGWFLKSQHHSIHPYTHADPGGWAWSDLPGAVPDADDTSGVLIALRNLDNCDEPVLNSVKAAISWLINLQNSDGGMPTFCRGWSNLPFDRSTPDITSHALAAMALWEQLLPADMQEQLYKAISKSIYYLGNVQREDGCWIPLWFGNQLAPKQENPVYGTAKVVSNLLKIPYNYHEGINNIVEKAVDWLLSAQNLDGGWGGDKAVESSIEETALAVDALAGFILKQSKPNNISSSDKNEAIKDFVSRGVTWLITETQNGTEMPASAIGLYFASLWYSERLYPVVFCLSALKKAEQITKHFSPDNHFSG